MYCLVHCLPVLHYDICILDYTPMYVGIFPQTSLKYYTGYILHCAITAKMFMPQQQLPQLHRNY